MVSRHSEFIAGSIALLLSLSFIANCGTRPLVPATAPATAPEKANWLDAVVNGHGGVVGVEKLASFRTIGQVTAHLRGGTGRVRREFVSPGQLLVQIDYPQKTEVRILDGDKGWRGDQHTQSPVNGLAHAAMVYQMIRLAAPWFLLHHADRVSSAGGEATDRDGAPVLRLVWSPLLTMEFWVDKDSERIEKVRGIISAQGRVMEFSTRYSDYREVEGSWLETVSFAPTDMGPFAPTEVASAEGGELKP